MAKKDNTEAAPDLFAEFGIAQDDEGAAVTGDEMSDLFLEAVGMDGREPEPNDPNFWEKHDKRHHHGHFDPETQRCSLREEVEQAEKAKDKGDDIGAEQPNVAGLEAPEKRGAEEEKDTDWENIDAEYMDAVKRGDIDVCAEMVRDAARKWGAIEDKNSIPMVLYHGNKKGVLLNPNNNDIALFATPSEESAKYFGKVSSLFLKMNNVLKINANGDDWNKIKVPPELREYVTRFPLEGKTEAPCDTIAWVAKMKGYDGVIISSVREGSGIVSDDYISLYPVSKTKSADPVTYDDKGNVIPLSKRFQADNPDIRFSKEGGATSAWDATTRAEAEAAKEILEKCLFGTTVGFAEHEYQGDGEEESRASVVSSELDAEYMDAVERGDLEKCAKLVQEAAAKAGYTQEAWHYGDLALKNSSDYNIPSGETHYGTREAALDRLRNRADSGAHEWAGYKLFEKDGKWFWQFKSEFYNTEEEAMKDMTSGGPFATKEQAEDDMAKDYGGKLTKVYLNVDGARTVDEDDPKLQEGEDIVRYRNAQEDPGSYSFKVADPTRVKSAAPVTYDDEGNVIPLSKRFDATNEDIRYSIGGIFTGSGADYANRSRQGGVDDGPSLKHIGTGEGSQVYGWGLYGSNNREVASGYAAGSFKPGLEVDGKQLPSDLATTLIASALDYYKGDEAAALADIRDSFKSMTSGGEMKKALQSAIEILEKNPGKVKSITQYPNLYEQTWFTNRTAGDESHLLNWYVPSANIKEQLGWIRTQAEKEGILDKPNKTGGTLRQGLETAEHTIIGRTGQDLYYMVEGVVGGPRAASEFLSRAGIDGIKYPVDSYGGKSIKDGDEAGWNYVAFSDKNIRVDHKWVNGEQRYFRNGVGKVVGTYDRASGKITLYPGAKPKDVVHEFSHGLWQFAEQEAAAGRSTLMTKFRTIADSAPQAVKDAVKANYGTDNPNVYLEECFTHEMARQSEGDSAFARAIETPEGRPWYRRAWGVIKNTWNRFAASKKLANVDVSKMDRMDAAQSAKFILRQLAKGAHFGTVQHTGNGTRKSIIGVKGAERLGMGKLDEAQKMSKGGASRENIWRKTGWWRGKDGKWRVEVPDVILPFETLPSVAESKKAHRFLMQNLDKYDVSTIRQLEERAPEAYSQYAGMKRKVEDIERQEASDQFTVRDFVQDTGLDMAYPELMKMPVRFKLQGSDIGLREHTGGYFDGRQIVIDRLSEPKQIRSHIAHELQHAIQDIEGFARGANGNIVDRSQYVRSAGEVESRNIQKRLDMTPEKRAAHPPWETEDVPEEKQIVMLSDKQGKTPDLFAEFGVTGDEAIDTTPDLFAEFGIAEQNSSSNKQESLPDLFAEFGITQGNQKSEDMRNALLEMVIRVLEEEPGDARPNLFSKKWAWKKSAIAGDEMADLFLEAVGMDGREPDPNDPNFWEKHDKIHHHGNFDPETQTCTLREEAENAEKEKDAGDDIGSEQPNVAGLESPSQRGAEESKRPKDKHQEVPKTDRTLSKTEAPKRIEGLSGKREKKYREMMAKKHPELDAEMVLTEIGKIEDKKIQEDAFKWVLKGAVKLPEDMYKVEQARELATKAKKDPFSWNTPQACINELLGLGHKVSLKPITIDELKKDPLFSDYRKLPEGVETFEVEDSREGQRRMREVIDTHWGEDANPWCLLARKTLEPWERSNTREDYEMSEEWWRSVTPQERKDIAGKIYKPDTSPDIIEDFVNADSIVDAEGAEDYYYKNIADPGDDLKQAWEYWNRYNALPKRVAFKDGKLLAFMATDSMDRAGAFDDAAYSSGSRLAEMYPDQYEEYEKWSETEVGKEEGANFYEWLEHEYPELSDEDALRNNVPEQWWDRDDEPHKGIPLGTIAIKGGSDERQIQAEQSSATGKIRYIGDAVSKKDGITTTWYGTSDKKRSEEYPDGSRKVWHPNGLLRLEEKSDGSMEVFHEDGRPLEKRGADGSKKVWHPNGQLHTERDSDGNQKTYDENGQLRLDEKYIPGAPYKLRKYDAEGQLVKEILPDETEREYKNGRLAKEIRSDGSTAAFGPNENMIWERLADNTFREFDPETGRLATETRPDGTWRRYSPEGEVLEEEYESR